MVWNMLKRHFTKGEPKTKDELMAVILAFWENELIPEVCNNFIDHIYKVVPVVKQIKGRASGDLPKKLFCSDSSGGRSIGYFDTKLQTPELQYVLDTLIKEHSKCNLNKCLVPAESDIICVYRTLMYVYVHSVS
jgi:hypothetical protein